MKGTVAKKHRDHEWEPTPTLRNGNVSSKHTYLGRPPYELCSSIRELSPSIRADREGDLRAKHCETRLPLRFGRNAGSTR